MQDKCEICDQSIGTKETVTLTEKGVQGLLTAANDCGDDDLSVCSGQKVHKDCRRNYTDPKRVSSSRKRLIDQNTDYRHILRSAEGVFTFSEEDCLFCGKSINSTRRKKGYKEFYTVRTNEFQDEIYNKSKKRNDNWGNEVMARIEYSRDLHASDAVYHQICSVRFRTGKDIADDSNIPGRKNGSLWEADWWGDRKML